MGARSNRVRQAPNAWLGAPLTVFWSVLALCIPASRTVFGTDVLRQTLVLGAIGLVLAALGYVARPPHPGVWIAAVCLIPLAAVMSGTNSSISASVAVGVSATVMIVTMVCVLTRLVRDRPQALRHILTWFLVGQTVSAAAGVLQLVGVSVGEGLVFGRATGLAEHPNTLGLMAAIAILVCLGVWRRSADFTRLVLAGVILVNGAALVGTGSLSAMLALAAGLAVGLLAARKVIGTAVTGVLVLALVGGALALANVEQNLLDSVFTRVEVVTGQSSGGGAASLEVRELTYAWAWDWINSSPFVGVGLDPRNAGTFDGVTVVHNYLLRGWYQGGILYVAWLALLSLTVVFGVVIAALRRRADPWAAAITFGILVFAFTAAFLNQPQYWMPLLLAIVCASRAPTPPPDDTSPPDEDRADSATPPPPLTAQK
ncbi:O-antigen ligase family protein [Microbacterium enclense]|uniref:O-antigen ligase family protein n=1 Tax=Microbacterium enclense TaxID=993073 RepID=A0A3S3MD41_9MICO|nr:O-antigen ligase family protein [Microbacterium enclense]RWR19184.1 O-antigen ligase family protein [Microbacterium enclense]